MRVVCSNEFPVKIQMWWLQHDFQLPIALIFCVCVWNVIVKSFKHSFLYQWKLFTWKIVFQTNSTIVLLLGFCFRSFFAAKNKLFPLIYLFFCCFNFFFVKLDKGKTFSWTYTKKKCTRATEALWVEFNFPTFKLFFLFLLFFLQICPWLPSKLRNWRMQPIRENYEYEYNLHSFSINYHIHLIDHQIALKRHLKLT